MAELGRVVPESFDRVFGWLGEHGIEPAGPPLVRYRVIDNDMDGPDDPNPDNWRTEIAIKLAAV